MTAGNAARNSGSSSGRVALRGAMTAAVVVYAWRWWLRLLRQLCVMLRVSGVCMKCDVMAADYRYCAPRGMCDLVMFFSRVASWHELSRGLLRHEGSAAASCTADQARQCWLVWQQQQQHQAL
jgi:hypothetical protein